MLIKAKKRNNVILAYITVCLVWGSTYLAIRIGVNELPPETFTGIRFIISSIFILLFAVLRGHQFPQSWTDIGKSAIAGLLFQGGTGMVVWAEQWVYTGITSLIVATGPILIAIIELALPGSPKMKYRGWLGLFIGVCGVTLLVFPGANMGAVNLKGGLILITAAFFWSIGSIYTQRVKVEGTLVINLAIQMFAGGLLLFITGLLIGESVLIHFSMMGIAAISYLIFVGTLVGYSSYIYLLQFWPAAKAGTYAFINPVVAIFLGTLFLGEPFTLRLLVSALIILGGVLLVQFSTSN